MPETSRDCVVILPDETQFTIPVQPSLLGSDLLNMAASHCKVKEKSYFGLMTEGDGFKNWLELDKPVLDPIQELPKGSDAVRIYFSFKYFIDSYQDLQDSVTVEMLYLQCRKAIEKGEIITDEDTIFELASLVMQATHGQFTTEEEAMKLLQALPVIPAYIFQKQSIKSCEEQVLHHYKMFEKYSRGQAIFRYLEIVQTLQMYSYHYFEVKDKNSIPLWLGVGPSGIVQCLHENRNDPVMKYQWINLQNIYYKDKKFSIEIYTTSKSPRKGSQPSSQVTLLAWYGKNSKVVMAIWKMVRDQHVFYRTRRTAKATDFNGELEDQKPGMSIAEILRHLNRKYQHGSISPSSSHSNLSIESAKSSQATGASMEALAAAKKAQQEMYGALLAKRDVLVEKLEKTLLSYKDLLLKEMQITGVPPEGLTAEEIEKMRTKFGINYKFSKFVLDKTSESVEGDVIEELETQLEIQSAIIEAQKSLVDQAKTRQLRKERKKEVKKAEEKYLKIDEKLSEVKKTQRRVSNESRFESPGFNISSYSPTSAINKKTIRHSSPSSTTPIDDNYLAKMIFDDSTHQISPLVTNQRSPLHKSTSALQDISEIPRPSSPGGHGHRTLTGTQSLIYPSHTTHGSYLTDSNRSYTSSYYSEFNDSLLREYESPPRSTVSSHSRYDDPNNRSNNLMVDDYLHYPPRDNTSPTSHHHHSFDYSHSHQNSSDASAHHRQFRTSLGGPLSPEPHYPNAPMRQRPWSTHSTHSNTTPPPGTDPGYHQRGVSQPQSMQNLSFTEREMDLQEALLMDLADEGTLV